jgi:hypothetical protein
MRQRGIVFLLTLLPILSVSPALSVPIHLPTHGAVTHLDPGPIIIAAPPAVVTYSFEDNLPSPASPWHVEVELANPLPLGTLTFPIGFFHEEPGVLVYDFGGVVSIPGQVGVVFHYHVPDIPETGPEVARLTVPFLGPGLPTIQYDVSVTEDPTPPGPPPPPPVDELPPPLFFEPLTLDELRELGQFVQLELARVPAPPTSVYFLTGILGVGFIALGRAVRRKVWHKV